MIRGETGTTFSSGTEKKRKKKAKFTMYIRMYISEADPGFSKGGYSGIFPLYMHFILARIRIYIIAYFTMDIIDHWDSVDYPVQVRFL